VSQNTYDISGLSARLSRAFPELAPVRVTGILGEGFNSTVVETDRDIVFRIARTPGIAERFIRERVILAGLRPHLPTSIPEPLWLLEASPEFPLGVSGYRRLAGQPLLPTVLRQDNVEMLAHDVAQLLAALHCIPLAFVPLLGTPHPAGALRAYQDIREATAPVLRERLDVAEFARIDAWWDELLSGEHLTN
jgi:aminoglycoside phosphotransferase (APT) family kinase protein